MPAVLPTGGFGSQVNVFFISWLIVCSKWLHIFVWSDHHEVAPDFPVPSLPLGRIYNPAICDALCEFSGPEKEISASLLFFMSFLQKAI
jgi:hypothetical protein